MVAALNTAHPSARLLSLFERLEALPSLRALPLPLPLWSDPLTSQQPRQADFPGTLQRLPPFKGSWGELKCHGLFRAGLLYFLQ